MAALGAVALSLESSTVVAAGDPMARGTLNERSFRAAIDAERCFGSTLRACIGIIGGARGSDAWATGTYVFQTHSAIASRPTFGIVGDVAWLSLTVPIETRLQAIGLWNPSPATFDVADISTATLSQPSFEAHFVLSFGLDLERKPRL